MTRSLPYVRAAFSITCATVAVLRCVLWVRSYWSYDYIGHPRRGALPNGFASSVGNLKLEFDEGGTGEPDDWHFYTEPVRASTYTFVADRDWIEHRFQWNITGGCDSVGIPHWFACSVFAAIAAIPWIPWSARFSLRTLLLVVTLGSIVLGLVAWAMKA
jgi:hypothetical protein